MMIQGTNDWNIIANNLANCLQNETFHVIIFRRCGRSVQTQEDRVQWHRCLQLGDKSFSQKLNCLV